MSIKINDECVLEDKEMLEDLIMAALGEVYRKVDEEMESTMKGMGGGMIPGLF
jgi:DNA-binding protein YbaB